MKRVELESERVAAARLEARRNRELQRQERIFNPKVRTIGIDKEALGYQVQEKISRHEAEARALKEHADKLVRSDRAACLLENRQQQDERHVARATVNFRQMFQQPGSRREFDLNDPEVLRKQEGVRILPGLAGEDLDIEDRTRRQRAQMKDWSLQQQKELDRAKELQRLHARRYDHSRITLDNQAVQLQNMEEEQKRDINIAIKNFNQALAFESRDRRKTERRQEEESDRADILNQLQGELLSESVRTGRDRFKGMNAEQIREFIVCQRQQVEDKERVRMEQREKQHQEDRLSAAVARAALLRERQQGRLYKQLRKSVDETNIQLAQAQHEQRKKEAYTSIPDERFFSQFNTCSR